MHYSRGTRVVLAFLVTVIFGAYMYLQIHGYEELRKPAKPAKATATAAAVESETPEAPAAPAQQESPAAPVGTPIPPNQAKPEEPTPTPAPTVDPESPYGKALANAAAQGLPQPPEIDIESWEFTLVNGDHSIGTYEPEQLAYLNLTMDETDIQTTPNDNRCAVDARIAQPLIDFCRACKDSGLSVYLSSGYRSYGSQAANFTRICQNNGVTDGKDGAGHYITMPAGCSEHQLALCCDVTDRYYQIKDSSIENTATYQWLNEHCAEFGFVQRFPAGKEDITGVMYEPWHFRYVGLESARYMTENHLALEEFLALYGVE